MKANICSVKYNPGSSFHVAVLLIIAYDYESDIISFSEYKLSLSNFMFMFSCRLVPQIITFITTTWEKPTRHCIYSVGIGRLCHMWSFSQTMSLLLHQRTVHYAYGMLRIMFLYVFIFLYIFVAMQSLVLGIKILFTEHLYLQKNIETLLFDYCDTLERWTLFMMIFLFSYGRSWGIQMRRILLV